MFGFGKKDKVEKRSVVNLIADYMSGGQNSFAGESVTASSSIQIGAVYACVKIISETIACLPLRVYQRADAGGRQIASNHPISALLSNPSTTHTTFELIETLVAWCVLRGNAYALKVRDKSGRITSLIPVDPRYVEIIKTVGGNVAYKLTPADGGEPRVVSRAEMLHVRGLSLDGSPVGGSVIDYQREVLGYAYAGMRHGASTFANGAAVGGVLEVPGTLSDAAFERLKTAFSSQFSGSQNAGKTKILEEGTKFNRLSMTPQDIEFLASRKFSRSEIAAMFRVPPHKIGDLEHATFSNIEHQSIEFVTDCILPWVRRFEAALDRDLIDVPGKYYTRFAIDGLLRGDMASRANYYRMGILDGWLNRNEVRELEERNAVTGLDEYLVPLNMVGNDTLQQGAKNG